MRSLSRWALFLLVTGSVSMMLASCNEKAAPPDEAKKTVIPDETKKAATPDETIAHCDALASDPHDPGRYAAGVTNEQLAPGAAIDACKAAVDAHSDSARSWYQLGRAYWAAEHEADALGAFVKAAKLGYAPAMKSIGDAYRDGRGLPDDQKQSFDVAMEWYKKAEAAGYREASNAQRLLSEQISKSTFDPSQFQNPVYMTKLYKGDFESIDNPIMFFAYTKAFSDELGGANMYFIDQDCKGMVTALGNAINGFGEIMGYLQTLQSNGGLAGLLASSLGSAFTTDQGIRDADKMASTYKCDSMIAKKIMANISGSYQKLPAIINAFNDKQKGADSGGYSQADAGVPLYRERITTLYWGVIAGDCPARSGPGCEKIQQLIASKQYDVITCQYGPYDTSKGGYKTYDFWHSHVPNDIASYTMPRGDHPFLILGKITVDKCPSTAGGVEPIFQQSRLSH